MSKPFYTSATQQDLVGILNYIAEDNPDAALAWVEKVEAKCLLIAENPGIGEPRPSLGDGVRQGNVLLLPPRYRKI